MRRVKGSLKTIWLLSACIALVGCIEGPAGPAGKNASENVFWEQSILRYNAYNADLRAWVIDWGTPVIDDGYAMMLQVHSPNTLLWHDPSSYIDAPIEWGSTFCIIPDSAKLLEDYNYKIVLISWY
jgi:hypothetical protein